MLSERFPDDNITRFAPALSRLLSKIKLQRQLDQPRGLGLQNLVEGLGVHVAVGNMEIRMIQDVEELRPELKFLRLCDADVLEQ